MYRSNGSVICSTIDVHELGCNIDLNIQPYDVLENVSVIELNNKLKSITVKGIKEELNIYCKVICKPESEGNVFQVLEGDFILADNKKFLVL